MLRVVTFFWLLASLSRAEIPQRYSYRCTHPNHESIYITFESKQVRVARLNSENKLVKNWELSEKLTLLNSGNEPTRIFFNSSESDPFEFREQMVRSHEAQSAEVGLIESAGLLEGWSCVYTGASMKVRVLSSMSEISPQDALLIRHWIAQVTEKKTLVPQAATKLKEILVRYLDLIANSQKKSVEGLIKTVFSDLNYLAPESMNQLLSPLSSNEKKIFSQIEATIAYSTFPPLQRWIFWAGLEAEGKDDAFRLAIREFIKSPLSKEPDMRSFIQKELQKLLRSMSKADVARITASLSESEKLFVDEIWKKSQGPKKITP